jgi:hypothetical protein
LDKRRHSRDCMETEGEPTTDAAVASRAQSRSPQGLPTRSATCATPVCAGTSVARHQVFVEYLTLDGVNDRYEHALALAALLEPRRAFKVNLIP